LKNTLSSMSLRNLDLRKYQSSDSKVFAGRERGAFVRDAAQLSDFERSSDDLEVHVPEATYAISSSFFLALFGETIRQLGGQAFRRRVHFRGKDISSLVEQAIWEAEQAGKPFSLS
jgi:hypothetical protein